MKYKFDCGCSFEILESRGDGVLPLMEFDIDTVTRNCPAVWKMLATGFTKGIFQLESRLGRKWSKKLGPESMEHIGALGAILRPGCLKGMDEKGVSMTENYCLRKNGLSEVRPYHKLVDDVLFPTYNVIVYQESAIAIAVSVAGFTPQEGRKLQKAISKKIPEVMVECKKMFMEGAAKVGALTQEQAEEVFGWIEKSQRYSFNKSHAISYGEIGYDTAYIKAHFPVQFFTAWIKNATDKDDARELVDDAKIFGIEVRVPDLRNENILTHTDGKHVFFGIRDIKSIGDSAIVTIQEAVAESVRELGKPVGEWSWSEFLRCVTPKIKRKNASLLISSGSLGWMGLERRRMLLEMDVWMKLTDKERGWLEEEGRGKGLDLISLLRLVGKPKKEGGGCNNKNRVEIVGRLLTELECPEAPVRDSASWIAYTEEELLGVALTCSAIDACDLYEVNTTCKEFLAGRNDGYMVLGVEIVGFREVVTKRGKNPGRRMAQVEVADASCTISNAVIFPEAYELCSDYLKIGELVIIQCERSKEGSLVLKKVWPAVKIGEEF